MEHFRSTLILFAAVFFFGQADGTSVAQAIRVPELYGAWLGVTEGDSEYVRLDLKSSGHGYCAIVSPMALDPSDRQMRRQIDVYKIVNWQLKENEILFRVEKKAQSSESISIHGTVAGLSLQIEFEGIGAKWTRVVRLERESTLDIANELAVKEIANQSSAQ